MGVFAQFFAWLQGQLAAYIGANVAAVAAAIEPAVVTMCWMYVMMWGYLHLRGLIQEPVMEGFKRMVMIAVVLGVAIRLWLYNDVLVDTFVNGPAQLARAILGAADPVSLIDQIWFDGNRISQALLAQGSVTDISYYLAAVVVYALVGLTCVTAAFLLALSSIATAILLALGPIFIVMLLFDATKRFFESWIGQLTNYAFITVLIALIASMLLSVVRAYSLSAVNSGAGVTIAESARLCMVSVLIFLLVRQVPSIAASLSSGIALSTYGTVSRSIDWALGTARRTAHEGSRGVLDGLRGHPVSRWDSLRRSAGNLVGSSIRTGLSNMRNHGGSLVPRERVMPRRN